MKFRIENRLSQWLYQADLRPCVAVAGFLEFVSPTRRGIRNGVNRSCMACAVDPSQDLEPLPTMALVSMGSPELQYSCYHHYYSHRNSNNYYVYYHHHYY